MMVDGIASATSLALPSLVGKGGQVPAAASVPARDDQLVVCGRDAARAPRFAATAHERALISYSMKVSFLSWHKLKLAS